MSKYTVVLTTAGKSREVPTNNRNDARSLLKAFHAIWGWSDPRYDAYIKINKRKENI